PAVAEVDPAGPGQDRSVSGDPSGQHAVEHIDAAGDRLDQVSGRADAHQVARTLTWQDRRLQREQAICQRLRFSETQPADAEAVKGQFPQDVRALPPKVVIESPLDDAKARLTGCRLRREAASRPAVR